MKEKNKKLKSKTQSDTGNETEDPLRGQPLSKTIDMEFQS